MLVGIFKELAHCSVFWNFNGTECGQGSLQGTVKVWVGEWDMFLGQGLGSKHQSLSTRWLFVRVQSACEHVWGLFPAAPSVHNCSSIWPQTLRSFPLLQALPLPLRIRPLSNWDKLSLKRVQKGEREEGSPSNVLACRAKMCLGRSHPAFAQNPGKEHVAESEPYCAPGSLMDPQIILMPFVWKLFVESSHFPTNRAECWASPKPFCLLLSPVANCEGRLWALNANEGNGWHSWGTLALGTPPLLLRSAGTVAERLSQRVWEERERRKASICFPSFTVLWPAPKLSKFGSQLEYQTPLLFLLMIFEIPLKSQGALSKLFGPVVLLACVNISCYVFWKHPLSQSLEGGDASGRARSGKKASRFFKCLHGGSIQQDLQRGELGSELMLWIGDKDVEDVGSWHRIIFRLMETHIQRASMGYALLLEFVEPLAW